MCIVQLPAKAFLQVALSQTIQDEGVFEAASSTTETPGPEGVVEAFVKLIETPGGKRPFRTANGCHTATFGEPQCARRNHAGHSRPDLSGA